MKINKFFAAAVAAVMMFASCSKEDNNHGGSAAAGSKAKISLAIQGNGMSRAGDGTIDNPTDEDCVINNMLIFVARSNGSFDCTPKFYTAAQVATMTVTNTTAQFDCTTAAKNVYIVCNVAKNGAAAASINDTPFASCASMTDVKNVVAKLDDADYAVVSKNVWIAGETASVTETGTHTAADQTVVHDLAATVDLRFVPAKVYVHLKNSMTNYVSDADTHTTVDGIMIMNGYAWSAFVKDANGTYKPLASSSPSNPLFYNGYTPAGTPTDPYSDMPAAGTYATSAALMQRTFANILSSTTGTGVIGATEVYINNSTAAGTPSHNGTYAGFYTCPSNTSNRTYVTVFGRYSPSAAVATNPADIQKKYWVSSFANTGATAPQVNATTTKSKLENGNKYVLDILLKGDAGSGGGGSDDPTNPTEAAYIKVTVTQPVWLVPTINQIIFE